MGETVANERLLFLIDDLAEFDKRLTSIFDTFKTYVQVGCEG